MHNSAESDAMPPMIPPTASTLPFGDRVIVSLDLDWLRLRTPEVKEIEVSRFLQGAVGLKPSAG